MPSSRRFANEVALLILAAMLCTAGQATAGTMIIDLHDGEPWNQMHVVNWSMAIGNFMPGIEAGWSGFTIDRFWFYHGGDYEESDVPYEVHVVYRETQGNGEIEFHAMCWHAYTTTCNYCWEVVEFGAWIGTDSDEEDTVGVFIRPMGGTAGNPKPNLWVDRYSDYEHLAAILSVSDWGRDPFDYWLDCYMSDIGYREVLLGMQVTGDYIVPVEEISFSVVKSLY